MSKRKFELETEPFHTEPNLASKEYFTYGLWESNKAPDLETYKGPLFIDNSGKTYNQIAHKP